MFSQFKDRLEATRQKKPNSNLSTLKATAKTHTSLAENGVCSFESQKGLREVGIWKEGPLPSWSGKLLINLDQKDFFPSKFWLKNEYIFGGVKKLKYLFKV